MENLGCSERLTRVVQNEKETFLAYRTIVIEILGAVYDMILEGTQIHV